MGIPLEEMIVWDPFQELGGNSEEQIRAAKVILWKGYCSVHQRFTVEHVTRVRKENPGIRVIVHPECRFEVAEAADQIGSTEGIIKVIKTGEPGSPGAGGTGNPLVDRLTKELTDRKRRSPDRRG